MIRYILMAFFALPLLLVLSVLPVMAEPTKTVPIPSHAPAPKNKLVKSLPERRLHLKSVHTGEMANAVFWRDGAYVPSGLKKLNRLLRDHRTGDVTQMDPELFMIVHRLYKDLGANGPIEVISGYRSKKTNDMLRAQGRKVATKSQHTLGKAMDIRLKGVSLKKARDKALSYGLGGVGYYQRSNFIHVDTGRPRFW